MKPNCLNYGYPRANYELDADLHGVLIELGFDPTNNDSNVYVLNNELGKTIIARAVDNMPLCYPGGNAMRH